LSFVWFTRFTFAVYTHLRSLRFVPLLHGCVPPDAHMVLPRSRAFSFHRSTWFVYTQFAFRLHPARAFAVYLLVFSLHATRVGLHIRSHVPLPLPHGQRAFIRFGSRCVYTSVRLVLPPFRFALICLMSRYTLVHAFSRFTHWTKYFSHRSTHALSTWFTRTHLLGQQVPPFVAHGLLVTRVAHGLLHPALQRSATRALRLYSDTTVHAVLHCPHTLHTWRFLYLHRFVLPRRFLRYAFGTTHRFHFLHIFWTGSYLLPFTYTVRFAQHTVAGSRSTTHYRGLRFTHHRGGSRVRPVLYARYVPHAVRKLTFRLTAYPFAWTRATQRIGSGTHRSLHGMVLPFVTCAHTFTVLLTLCFRLLVVGSLS